MTDGTWSGGDEGAPRRGAAWIRALAELADSIPAVVWIAHPDGTTVSVNRAWREYAGLLAEGGEPAWPLVIHPDDRAASVAAWEEAVRSVRPFRSEQRLRAADGSYRWHQSTAEPTLDDEGRPALWVGIATDVEDGHRAAAEARSSRALLDAAQAAAGLGSFRVNLVTGEMVCTDEVPRLLGYEPGARPASVEEAIARIHPDDQAIARTALAAARQRDLPADVRVRTVRRGGDVRSLHAVGEVRAEDGSRLLVGTVQDVTGRVRAEEERRALERRLRDAERLESLAELAGGVAHDFNNLLVSIVGHAALAESTLPPTAAARTHLAAVREATQRATRLARRMLALSGRGHFATAQVDLRALVSEHAAALRELLPRGVELHLDLPEALPPTLADGSQVRQLLEELVVNAAEALDKRAGTVTLTTRATRVDGARLATAREGREVPPGPFVELTVEDTGGGMDPATLARAFDPFFSTKFAGRGLGLTVVLGIVRGHAGALFVDSAPGSGTRVVVLLPATAAAGDADPSAAPPAEEPRAAPAPPPAAPRGAAPRVRAEDAEPPPATGPLVLVVDDEPQIRSVARRILQRRGFRVLEAANGRECLEVLAERSADVKVVLLDVVMPELDGAATLREIRREFPHIRVLLASGYPNLETTERARDLSPDGFLPKPFDFDELARRLRELAGE